VLQLAVLLFSPELIGFHQERYLAIFVLLDFTVLRASSLAQSTIYVAVKMGSD
jgi:hypothetical protein